MMDYAMRVAPLDIDAMTDEQKELTGGWEHLTFSRTLVRHPGMYRTFVPFIKEVIANSTLGPREREMLCLRILELCGEVYELEHHKTIASRAGLGADEIAAAIGGGGASLSPFDMHMIHAAEELYRDQRLSDATWSALRERYDEAGMIEVVCLAGCYMTIPMFTQSCGVQVEQDNEAHEKVNALRTYT